MFVDTLFCSYFDLIKWLQNNLLTCPFKKLTGFDCPGCGFQRAVLALVQGNIIKSLQLYPAAIPILLIALLTIVQRCYLHNKIPVRLINGLYIITFFIITGAYLVKLTGYINFSI